MKIHDESRVPEFIKMLDELTSTHLEIGIFGDSGFSYMDESGNTVTVLEIATFHEFGTKFTPERSFLRSGFDNSRNKIISKGDKFLEDVINLKLPVNIFFETMGEYIVGLIQEYLTDLRDPPLKKITIDRKGSSNPLVDTGRLRQSITYKVVRN